jgi:putative membrane protein
MAFQEVTMRLAGWGALACAAVLTIACDARSTDRYDDSPTVTRDNASTTDRDGLDNDIAIGTSGQAPRDAADARRFAEQAMMANKAEVRLGELAGQRAQSAAVKEFAQMMVRDHTKGLNDLKAAVKGHGIEEPAQLDAKHQGLYDRLSKLSGAEFDRAYMMAMVDGHREVQDLLDDRATATPATRGTSGGRAADNSQLDAAVNQWATQKLPGVKQHLQRAEQVNGQLK